MNKKIFKGMNKNEVNRLLLNKITLIDEVFLGHKYKHNWKCNCGEVIEGRRLDLILRRNQIKCEKCNRNVLKESHKINVEINGLYEYIDSYFKGDILDDGSIITKNKTYVKVKHKYCGAIIIKDYYGLVKKNKGCTKCCKTYENSFAYHIEKELGLKLEDVWDFEKNTVNPYHIWKSTPNKKVWIKCYNKEVNELNGLMKKDYHESYSVSCNNFYNGKRCNSCSGRVVHKYDSFGYANLAASNSLLVKENTSAFNISKNSRKTIEFICQKCGNVVNKKVSEITKKGILCKQCNKSEGEIKIEIYLQNNDINYYSQKEYDNLTGIGNGKLSYDFYLPEYNMLIEYQGEFHDGNVRCQSEYQLKYQQEHDRRKREYAEKNGIRLLEIWYWDFNNIENILEREIK